MPLRSSECTKKELDLINTPCLIKFTHSISIKCSTSDLDLTYLRVKSTTMNQLPVSIPHTRITSCYSKQHKLKSIWLSHISGYNTRGQGTLPRLILMMGEEFLGATSHDFRDLKPIINTEHRSFCKHLISRYEYHSKTI